MVKRTCQEIISREDKYLTQRSATSLEAGFLMRTPETSLKKIKELTGYVTRQIEEMDERQVVAG